MFGIQHYGAFLLACVLLNLTPGSDTVYILTTAAAGGRRQGIASALGISTGCLLHTLLAALGLSAVLAASATAFTLVKLAGGGYLIFLGLRAIFSKQPFFTPGQNPMGGTLVAYRRGVLTNALNPKAALFFLALLPAYVSPASSHGPLPFLLLGLTFVCTSTLWGLALALMGTGVSRLLRSSPRAQAVAGKAAGCIYIALGAGVLRARLEA